MANFSGEKQRFPVLDVSEDNYLMWRKDVKLHLQSRGLDHTIKTSTKKNDDKVDEANAMIFMHLHMSQALKMEFLTIDRLSELWEMLKAWFENLSLLMLSQAVDDWSKLRLMDFHTVKEYNSEVHRLSSLLKTGGKPLLEATKLELTFSTMHSSNVVLLQQYRQRGFQTYSELIEVLSLAERHNTLLMKKNRTKNPLNAPRKRPRCRKGRKSCKDGQGNQLPDNPIPVQRDQKLPNSDARTRHIANTYCSRYGSTEHWPRLCRTPKHLTDLYQASIRGRRPRINVAEAPAPTNLKLMLLTKGPKKLSISQIFWKHW